MILNSLISMGILQFGNFHIANQWRAYAINFDLLPSYPDLLREIANQIARQLQPDTFDFLVCPVASLSLGILVSQEINKPLVYMTGNFPDVGFVGAFDIGHPAVFISHETPIESELTLIAQRGCKVGLDFLSAFAIIHTHNNQSSILPTQALLDFDDLVDNLFQADLIERALFDTLKQN